MDNYPRKFRLIHKFVCHGKNIILSVFVFLSRFTCTRRRRDRFETVAKASAGGFLGRRSRAVAGIGKGGLDWEARGFGLGLSGAERRVLRWRCRRLDTRGAPVPPVLGPAMGSPDGRQAARHRRGEGLASSESSSEDSGGESSSVGGGAVPRSARWLVSLEARRRRNAGRLACPPRGGRGASSVLGRLRPSACRARDLRSGPRGGGTMSSGVRTSRTWRSGREMLGARCLRAFAGVAYRRDPGGWDVRCWAQGAFGPLLASRTGGTRAGGRSPGGPPRTPPSSEGGGNGKGQWARRAGTAVRVARRTVSDVGRARASARIDRPKAADGRGARGPGSKDQRRVGSRFRSRPHPLSGTATKRVSGA